MQTFWANDNMTLRSYHPFLIIISLDRAANCNKIFLKTLNMCMLVAVLNDTLAFSREIIGSTYGIVHAACCPFQSST